MLTKLEQIQNASLNASFRAIVERLDEFDERLRNVEDGLMLVMNKPEPKPKKHVKVKKDI